DDLFDLESKNDKRKKILYDASIDDLMSEDKVFDPEICVKFFSPTYVSLPFTDRHYLIFTDDESLSDEDVPEDNVKIYSNPLFEFGDEYISSDVNPLFDEVLEDIECKDSYDSNLDESTFLVTPLSDSNEDVYFTPGDDVELLLQRDPSIPKMSEYRQQEQAANLSTHTPEPSRRFNSICYDDDDDYDYEESTISLNEIISQIPPSIVITTSLPSY
nr:hypothetical protein [Tanacetum cinerariifolium]